MWKAYGFWMLTAMLFVVHSLGFWEILVHLGRVKPIWFLLEIVEFVIFIVCREIVLAAKNGNKTSR